MMKTITPFELAAKMIGMTEEVNLAVEHELKKAAQKVQKTAQSKFGEYQPSVGPFPGWAALNPKYVQEKIAAGASGHNPLIGVSKLNNIWPTSLRRSIEYKVDPILLEAHVGTNDPLGEWHEFGLMDRKNPLPPRPFLRPSLYENRDWIQQSMREAIQMGLVRWLH